MTYDPQQPHLHALAKEYAERLRRTIFFVGAGVSAEAGMPLWSDLKDGLLRAISSELDSPYHKGDIPETFRNLEELAHDNKYWEFFDLADKEWPTTCSDYFSEVFDEKIEAVPTPRVYKKLWSMTGVRQIFTLNVDLLVKRAFYEAYTHDKNQLFEYNGFNVADSLQIMAKDNYCLVNLHGTYAEKSNWIMNATQRHNLIGGSHSRRYLAFIGRLFQEYNVVFVGVSPTDVALAPFLQRATELGTLGRHFWICPSPSAETRKWSQKNGVRLIEYIPEKSDDGRQVHSQDICAILDDIDKYISRDERVSLPSIHIQFDPVELGDVSSVLMQIGTDRDAAVQRLAGAVEYLGTRFGYESKQVSNFLNEYRVPIQLVSILDSHVEQFSEFTGYKVVKAIQARGNSSVWAARSATDETGEYVAVKVLGGQSLNEIVERESFRRGIESLFLLNQTNDGVAPRYYRHSEVPLGVVMEHVSGATLREFRSSDSSPSPEVVLGLFLGLCRAVFSCHSSDGQVLHRDIKPGNIILQDWYLGYDTAEAAHANVRLLNFDRSWHRFTSGNTKEISAEDIGYYPPEQRYTVNAEPPRSTLTDVYMLGMILFFLLLGEDPPDGGARLAGWREETSRRVRLRLRDRVLANRVSRLVHSMTAPETSERVDLRYAIAEIDAIARWQLGNWDNVDDDFVVEYLASSTERDYEWNRHKQEAIVGISRQVEFSIQFIQRGRRVRFEFFRARGESENRAAFGEQLRKKVGMASIKFSEQGWELEMNGNSGFAASIRVDVLKEMGPKSSELWKVVGDTLFTSFS